MGYKSFDCKPFGLKWTHECDRWKTTTYTDVALPWPFHQMPPHTSLVLAGYLRQTISESAGAIVPVKFS